MHRFWRSAGAFGMIMLLKLGIGPYNSPVGAIFFVSS